MDDSGAIQSLVNDYDYAFDNHSMASLAKLVSEKSTANNAWVSLLNLGDRVLAENVIKLVQNQRSNCVFVVIADPSLVDKDLRDCQHICVCPMDELNRTLIDQFFVIANQNNVSMQLQHESHCYREMVDSCPDYVFIRDRENRIVFANTAVAKLHDLPPLEMIGQTYTELTGDIEGGKAAAIQDGEIIKSGTPFYQHEDFYHDENGSLQWNRVSKRRIPNADGSDFFVLGVATDLTEWKKKETQLQESESKYKELYSREQVLGQISDTISGTSNIDSMLRQVGEQLPSLFNTSHAGIRYHHTDVEINVVTSDGSLALEIALKTMTKERKNHALFEGSENCSIVAASIHAENANEHILYAVRPAGIEPFTEQDSELLGAIANQCLVAIAKTTLHKKIQHQAHHDSLTGLPNRLHFEKMLTRQILGQHTESKSFAVLFLDLDGFKTINDSYGHLVGDNVLQEVALRFSQVVVGKGLLARMGGDEFSFLLQSCSSKQTAEEFANLLLKNLDEDICVDAQRFSVGASIGIALCPEDGNEMIDLMRKADSAMYHAKSAATTHIAFFNSEIEAKDQRRIMLERDLATALLKDELELHYQPQYDLKTKSIIGVEALARWQHPEFGFISPEEFIGIAEQSYLIIDLGKWVIETAFKQAKIWQNAGYDFKTAINLSPKQCEQESFSTDFLATLKRFNLEPSCIEVEVTESTLMKDLDSISEHLKELRSNGIYVAIDDFGTGYSSLGYLQHLPLDILKIDRSFVTSMNVDEPESSLIAVIARMAMGLGLTTVVEGVETEAQLNAATQVGCDYCQGWYFSKALPASDLTQLLLQSAVRKPTFVNRAA